MFCPNIRNDNNLLENDRIFGFGALPTIQQRSNILGPMAAT
jgi:hypothetical protein